MLGVFVDRGVVDRAEVGEVIGDVQTGLAEVPEQERSDLSEAAEVPQRRGHGTGAPVGARSAATSIRPRSWDPLYLSGSTSDWSAPFTSTSKRQLLIEQKL